MYPPGRIRAAERSAVPPDERRLSGSNSVIRGFELGIIAHVAANVINVPAPTDARLNMLGSVQGSEGVPSNLRRPQFYGSQSASPTALGNQCDRLEKKHDDPARVSPALPECLSLPPGLLQPPLIRQSNNCRESTVTRMHAPASFISYPQSIQHSANSLNDMILNTLFAETYGGYRGPATQADSRLNCQLLVGIIPPGRFLSPGFRCSRVRQGDRRFRRERGGGFSSRRLVLRQAGFAETFETENLGTVWSASVPAVAGSTRSSAKSCCPERSDFAKKLGDRRLNPGDEVIYPSPQVFPTDGETQFSRIVWCQFSWTLTSRYEIDVRQTRDGA